ncbi:unnamed protein product [Prorocentrum cordatum]|uniref:Voltage-gated hydrogen channel 1 n=1 Tax=Prorocentrum cordatum TaxID=2364126 RepID=A0ABN9S5X2_9DINO|nr:unnamed protein product [Polarella glacialis]
MGWASTEDRAVPQALEKLRLDMEEVFDRHRELYGGKPPTTPTQSQSPRRCTVSAREVGAKTLPRPSLGPHEGKRAAQPQLAGLRRPPVSSSQPQSPAPQPQSPVSPVPSPSASAPTSPLRHSVRREISARLRNNTFDITESENNWMHSLLKMESTSRMSMSSRRALGAAVARVSAAAPTCVQRFVRRPAYELAQVLVIFLDAVLVVWEMQHAAQGAAPSAHLGAGGIADAPLFTVLLDISCACVLVDQLLRLAGGKFDQTLGAFWQSFHLLVAATQLLQAIGHHSHLHQRSSSQFRVGLAMLSTLRIGRVLSLVLVSRVIRQHRFFRELRIMVHALAGVVKVLLWSSLLIFTILLMFGTVLSEGTLALLVRSGPGSAPPSLQENGSARYSPLCSRSSSRCPGASTGSRFGWTSARLAGATGGCTCCSYVSLSRCCSMW